ncbi:hypothetical protein K2173_001115 [Erythroxylum novogranatense]|uniref:Uncharacterized protein n=1 Tax=Erythroxylum novogranatense TaxID=1862640 RepID=A0AAV8TI60_9ROSI|nr:hypothetical protein K2173_001115 [Erythroxylum novogranatense]
MLVLDFLLLIIQTSSSNKTEYPLGVLQGGIRNIQVDDKSLTERGNGVLGDVILCREGHRKGTRRRLAASITTSTSSATNTTRKNEKNNGENKANSKLKTSPTNGQQVIVNSSPVSGNRKVTDDHYLDLMDIAEMDYSPAKRKPPIHNSSLA